jgi:MFS family permease
VLIVLGGTSLCFVLNAVSFVFIIAALILMRPDELYRGAPVGRQKGQLRAGLEYVWHTAELRSLLLLTLVVGTFAINSPVVLPLLAKITFDGNAGVYGWMSVAMGAGAMVGGLVAANRSDTHGRMLVITGMTFGISICVSSFAPTLAVFVGLLVIVGGGQIAFLATCNSLLQLLSDPVMRGRVMAVYTITLLGTTPIGGPLVGWISEQYGPRWGFAVGGIATIIGVLVFGTAFVKARRHTHELAGASGSDDLVLGVDGEAIPASVT